MSRGPAEDDQRRDAGPGTQRRRELERLSRTGASPSAPRSLLPLPFGLARARFHAHYPGLYWMPGYWPTRDGVIPWRTFWLLIDATAAAAAFAQLQQFGAISLALACVLGKEDAQGTVQQTLEELKRTAFGTP